jgi:hypothetical protein
MPQTPSAAGPPDGRSGDGAIVRRPAGVSDALVEAVGRLSEGFEYLERARGHLYGMHQLTGRADILFGDAADLLDACGQPEDAARVRREIVGRNVLDGRWTFQIVEEFDDVYYEPVRAIVRHLEAEHMDGRRHVFESELKERRRSTGRPGHEARPPAAHSPVVEVASPAFDTRPAAGTS